MHTLQAYQVINISPSYTIQNTHSNQISDLLYLQNQKLVITASGDNTLKSWNISQEINISIKTFTGHTSWVRAILQIDSDLIVSGGSDNQIIYWNTTSGLQIGNIVTPAAVLSLTYDKNYDYIFAGSGYCASCPASSSFGVRVYNRVTKNIVATLTNHSNVINSLCFLEKHLIASGSGDGKINIYNYTTAKILYQFQGLGYFPVFKVLKVPNQTIILAGNAYGQVLVFNYSNPSSPLINTLQFHGINKIVNTIIHIQDNLYASGSDDTFIYIADFQTSQLINNISGQTNDVQTILFIQSDSLIVSGDYKNLVVWKTQLCPTGQYQISSLQSVQCEKCSFQCQACQFTSNNCTLCSSIRINAPVCTCPQQYYDNMIQTQCQNCAQKCQTCDITGCILCSTGRQVPPGCLCQDGKYEDQAFFCQICSSRCQRCFGPTFGECIACSPTFYLFQSSCLQTCQQGYYQDSINNICLSACFQSFYLNSSSGKCEQCHQNCLYCHGKNVNQCYACITGFYLFQSICQQDCGLSFYFAQNNTRTCQRCSDYFLYCSTCTNLKCTQCQDGLYPDESYNCVQCHQKCKTCFGPYEYHCSSCNSYLLRQLVSFNNTCMCKSGFIEKGFVFCESATSINNNISTNNNSSGNLSNTTTTFTNIQLNQPIIQKEEIDMICMKQSTIVIISILWPLSLLLVIGFAYGVYLRKKMKVKEELTEVQEELVYLKNELKNNENLTQRNEKSIQNQVQEFNYKNKMLIINQANNNNNNKDDKKKQQNNYDDSSLQNIDLYLNSAKQKEKNIIIVQGEDTLQSDDRQNSDFSVNIQKVNTKQSLHDNSQLQIRDQEDFYQQQQGQKNIRVKANSQFQSKKQQNIEQQSQQSNENDENSQEIKNLDSQRSNATEQYMKSSMVQPRQQNKNSGSPKKPVQIQEDSNNQQNQEQFQPEQSGMKFKRLTAEGFYQNDDNNNKQPIKQKPLTLEEKQQIQAKQQIQESTKAMLKQDKQSFSKNLSMMRKQYKDNKEDQQKEKDYQLDFFDD